MSANRKATGEYDIFICHASEDKAKFVRPLANALRSFGARVWYDEFSLSVGDSLSRAIDRGLAKSSYGLVVLSPAFLKKAWPEYELAGLVAKEIGRKKVILPIWRGITKAKLLKYSPPLADKYALRSDTLTIIGLAAEVIAVVRPDLYEKVQRRVAFVRSVREGRISQSPAKKIKFGPPRHKRLPLDLVSRVRLIRAALLPVYPHSMKFWIDGFRGDFHPSAEIRIWERITACAIEYCSMTKLKARQRKEVFEIFCALSSGVGKDQLGDRLANLPGSAWKTIQLLWKYPIPLFDIKGDPFPGQYKMTAKDEERFKQVDSESFPDDVSAELVETLLSRKINRRGR